MNSFKSRKSSQRASGRSETRRCSERAHGTHAVSNSALNIRVKGSKDRR